MILVTSLVQKGDVARGTRLDEVGLFGTVPSSRLTESAPVRAMVLCTAGVVGVAALAVVVVAEEGGHAGDQVGVISSPEKVDDVAAFRSFVDDAERSIRATHLDLELWRDDVLQRKDATKTDRDAKRSEKTQKRRKLD